MNRREHLLGLGSLLAGTTLVGIPRSASASVLPAAADTSQLIYITPIKSDGTESRCQAEVWFMRQDDSLYVVTATDAWRARAVKAGLGQARIWLGDVGVWSRNEEYRDLPSVMGQASLVSDPGLHTALLKKFGGKYPEEWGTWGPRFQEGLTEGSRVLIRYQVA